MKLKTFGVIYLKMLVCYKTCLYLVLAKKTSSLSSCDRLELDLIFFAFNKMNKILKNANESSDVSFDKHRNFFRCRQKSKQFFLLAMQNLMVEITIAVVFKLFF